MSYTKADMKKMYRAGVLLALMDTGVVSDTVERSTELADATFEGALAILKKAKEQTAAGKKFDPNKALEALAKEGQVGVGRRGNYGIAASGSDVNDDM